MEARPTARRFEVYGTRGSAILLEPFESQWQVRLCLEEAGGDYDAGVHVIDLAPQTRQDMYDRELDAFVAVLQQQATPDRTLDHEATVQETLLRATGGIPA